MAALVPSGPPVEVELEELAPLVRELWSWLGPEGHPGLLGSSTLDELVRFVLVPLAELSLVDGQPVIPELGSVLVRVLGDPRLGHRERDEVELVLLDSEEFEARLLAESRGG